MTSVIGFYLASCNGKQEVRKERTFQEKQLVLKTCNMPDNKELFNTFLKDLEEDLFVVTERSAGVDQAWEANETGETVVVNGSGTRKYIIKRKEAKPKGYYPDFILYVFEFENNTAAQKNYGIIRNAIKSGKREFKMPDEITINGNEVFYLVTRAEMFRIYIKKYAEKLYNY